MNVAKQKANVAKQIGNQGTSCEWGGCGGIQGPQGVFVKNGKKESDSRVALKL